jgi:hypothetical protein
MKRRSIGYHYKLVNGKYEQFHCLTCIFIAASSRSNLTTACFTVLETVKVKVKQSRYRPGVAQRFPL